MERVRWTIDGNRAVLDSKSGEWRYEKATRPYDGIALPEPPPFMVANFIEERRL